MCCIDCRKQKLVLNPTKIFNVQGSQENRHMCATLADIFPDPETGKGVKDAERLLFYYLFKIIHKILLILLKMTFIHSDIINNS